jgi:hypothetical protein
MLNRPFKEPHKIDGEFGEGRSYGLHSGEDWNGTGGGNTDCGYKLFPITKGEVIHTSEADTGYGKVVVYKIEGPWGLRWIRYCHCKEIIAKSGLVTPDTVIATLGTTGNSTYCHLHWDVIKKPMRNWRTYAKDQATLDEYFESPTAFFNMWKDVQEEEDMPEWFRTLLRENNQDPDGNWESWFRSILGKAKDYDDKIKELTEQVKSANETLADKSLEVSTLMEKVDALSSKVAELEEQLNETRDTRDKEAWRADKLEVENKTLKEEVENLNNKIDRLESENSLKAYTWFERLISLFKR